MNHGNSGNLGIGYQFDVAVLARIGHFRSQNTDGAVHGGKGFIDQRHNAANGGAFLGENHLKTGIAKIEGRLNSRHPAADDQRALGNGDFHFSNRLEEFDPRQAQIVELRFFSGLTVEEVAGVLGVSARTVRNDWRVARAWLSVALGVTSLILLLRSRTYSNHTILASAAVMVFVSIWLDKGAGMMTGGFNPSPLGRFTLYFPSWVEIMMGIGLYALGALILTVLYRIAATVKRDAR